MTTSKENDRTPADAAAADHRQGVPGRRRYTAPRILFHETLEVVASTCSSPTSKGNPGACPEGPIQS